MARLKRNGPATAFRPPDRKQPRIASPPHSFCGGVIAWRFSGVDKNGPFSWAKLDDGVEFMSVLGVLAALETMSEANQKQRGCHFIAIDGLSKEAKKRLAEIQLDDLDELYSIRLTSRGRVFCVHHLQYMRVLWFDPEHKVCPVTLKHT